MANIVWQNSDFQLYTVRLIIVIIIVQFNNNIVSTQFALWFKHLIQFQLSM